MKTALTSLALDARLAWHGLTRQKAFAILVVLVLSAGLGSATTAFAVFESMQLRSLPFTDPARLVQIAMSHDGRPLEAESVYRQDLLAFGERHEIFAGMAAFSTGTVNLSDGGRAERHDAGFITPTLFPLLGLQPAAGRHLTAEDAVPGAPAAVVISDELWRTRYASDPAIVGRQIRVNRRVATVVGVMPPGFAFPHQQRLWLPLPDASRGDATDASRVIAVARLEPGFSADAVVPALDPLFEDARRQHPDRYQGYRLRVQPLSWYFVDWQARAGQSLLLTAVIALLLVAMANATGLMLAHARHREPEWALRTALGAPRGDRLRATLASSVMISAASLALSLAFARAALIWLEGELLRSEDPMPYFLRFGLTGATVAFACVAAAGAAVVAGLLPGLRVGTTALTSGMGAATRSTGSPALARFSGALVAVQIALSLTVVVAMAVLVMGAEGMGRREVGADPRGLLTARLALLEDGPSTDQARAQFWTQLADRLRSEPGIAGATVASAVPGFAGNVEAVRVEGAEPGRDILRVSTGAVDSGFLDTYGVRLVAGRALTERDDAQTMPVALVDRRFAESAWPGRDPVGRRLRLQTQGSDWVTVVGVTANLHLAQVDDPPRGAVLLPLLQQPPRFATVAVRTDGDPYSVLPMVRAAVGGLDPDVPLYWIYSLEDAIRYGYYNVRIFARVIGWLGLSALVVTAAGLYALLSGRVAQRRREIGVRRALGASGLAIGRHVVGQVLVPIGAGTAVGLACAWPVARALVALEPSVLGADPGVYGLAVGTLIAGAVLALVGPTARALVITPIEALRAE
jgi:putative ABC transport system permease protein